MIQIEDSLALIALYLAEVSTRDPGNRLDSDFTQRMATHKRKAIESGDEELAKSIWCWQAIQRCQNSYIRAFHNMKAGYFYDAWCALEQVENILNALELHFDLDVQGNDAYKLLLIRKNTEQFQRLFPYGLFFSIGAVVLEKKCSICDQPTSLRNPCSHRVGQIYAGEMCKRIITKADLVEVSLVDRPAQKCTVPFMVDDKSGKAVDHYNYMHIHYAVECLQHPFSKWELVLRKRNRPTSDFAHVGKHDECPCGSTRAFADCCHGKQHLTRSHMQIRIEEAPDAQIPAVLDYAIVRGKPRYPHATNGTDIA